MSETKRTTRAFEMRDELEQARTRIARLEAELRKADELLTIAYMSGAADYKDELRKADEAIVRVQNMSPAEWSRVWCPFCKSTNIDKCNDGCTAEAARSRLTPEAERRGD